MTNELINKGVELNREISKVKGIIRICKDMLEATTTTREAHFSYNGTYADVPQHYVKTFADVLFNYHTLRLLELEKEFDQLGKN